MVRACRLTRITVGALRSFGLGGGSTTSRVPEYVVDGSGDSGLGCTKNIG